MLRLFRFVVGVIVVVVVVVVVVGGDGVVVVVLFVVDGVCGFIFLPLCPSLTPLSKRSTPTKTTSVSMSMTCLSKKCFFEQINS